jgi:hypothetical protein
MPVSKATQLRFFEHCQLCGAIFPDSLIRIPQMTTVIKKMAKYLDALLYRQGADMDYLDKEFGKPVDEAVFVMLHAAKCPACEGQSNGPVPEAVDAANELNGLMVKIRELAKRLPAP